MSAPDTENKAAGKRRRGRRGAEDDQQAAAPSTELKPTATSFDFLQGAYEKVRKARLIQLIASGVGLVAVVAVGVFALTSWLEIGQVESERASQTRQLQDRQQDLIEAADIGPLRREQMQSYIDRRGADLAEVATRDLPLVAVIDQLEAAFPSGVAVRSVSLNPESSSDDDGGGSDRYAVTLNTQVDNFAALEQLDTELGNLALFPTKPELSWSGGSDTLSVTITGQIAPQTLTSRAQQIEQVLDDSTDSVPVDDALLNEGGTDPTAPDDGVELDLDAPPAADEPDSDGAPADDDDGQPAGDDDPQEG